MDPLTLIVGALGAGALKGIGESASAAVKDAYTALKGAVGGRFAGNPAAEMVLAEHAEDPGAYEKPLEKHVRNAGLADDPRIVELSQALMRLMDEEGSRTGKYAVDLRHARGVQVGDHNTQTNTFS